MPIRSITLEYDTDEVRALTFMAHSDGSYSCSVLHTLVHDSKGRLVYEVTGYAHSQGHPVSALANALLVLRDKHTKAVELAEARPDTPQVGLPPDSTVTDLLSLLDL